MRISPTLDKLDDEVPIPPKEKLNVNLSSAREATMLKKALATGPADGATGAVADPAPEAQAAPAAPATGGGVTGPAAEAAAADLDRSPSNNAG